MPALLLKKLLPYIAALVIAISIFFVGDMHGATKCEVKEANAKTTAAGKAQLAITKVGEKYGPELKQIEAAPDDNTVVGPITTHAIDGLR